jgi:hypothetical protein
MLDGPPPECHRRFHPLRDGLLIVGSAGLRTALTGEALCLGSRTRKHFAPSLVRQTGPRSRRDRLWHPAGDRISRRGCSGWAAPRLIGRLSSVGLARVSLVRVGVAVLQAHRCSRIVGRQDDPSGAGGGTWVRRRCKPAGRRRPPESGRSSRGRPRVRRGRQSVHSVVQREQRLARVSGTPQGDTEGPTILHLSHSTASRRSASWTTQTARNLLMDLGR